MPLEHFETHGGRLAVQIDGQGPLVICAPGMGDLRDAYTPVASQLVAQGFRVAVMDVRGHGDSSTDFDKYGDEATAEDFIFLAEKLGAPAVLMGASFSAGAATIASGRRPDLVAGVILFGPFLRLPNAAATYITPMLFMKPWGPTLWQSYSATLWPGLGKDGAKERAAKSTAMLTGPGRWSAFRKTVAGCDHRVVGPWLEKARNTPALVVMGDKDPDWSDPLKEAEWVASNFSDVRSLTVPGCGHAPQLESPNLVGKNITDFLAHLQEKNAFNAPRTGI